MIEKFENYLRSIKGYSDNTVMAYCKDIRIFAKWMKNHKENARWSTITRDDIDDYVTELVKAGKKPATTNRHLASIASFYNMMKRDGVDIENPCKYESRRKRAETIPNTIPAAQLKQAYDHALGVTKLIIGLLATTGARIQEILDLNWEDINFNENSIVVNGKGRRERKLYTKKDIIDPLRKVSEYRPQTGRMFNLEQRSVRYDIYQALRPYCTARQLSPHAIRHSFATTAANNGIPTSTLAQILGHKHLETTQRYIDLRQAPIENAMKQGALF